MPVEIEGREYIDAEELAALLGVTTRAARKRIAASTECRTIERTGKTGTRNVVMVPRSLFIIQDTVRGTVQGTVSDEEKAANSEPKRGTLNSEQGTDYGQSSPLNAESFTVQDTVRDTVSPGEVYQMRERIRELTTALDIEREAHKRAELLHLNTQGELSALRERAAQLEQLNTRLIEALPERKQEPEADKVPEDPYQNTVLVPTEAPQGGTIDPGRVNTPPDSSEGKKRAWWQLWKR